jgi:hypothetical protein
MSITPSLAPIATTAPPDGDRAVARHALSETLARRHRVRAPGRFGTLQSALAWDLLRSIRTDFSVPKDKYIASVAAVRLDALENYMRGMLATTAEEKVQHYREAVRLNPDYAKAGWSWARPTTRSAPTNRPSPRLARSRRLPRSRARPISISASPPTLMETSPNPKAPLSSSPRACRWPRSTTTWEWSPPAAARKSRRLFRARDSERSERSRLSLQPGSRLLPRPAIARARPANCTQPSIVARMTPKRKCCSTP